MQIKWDTSLVEVKVSSSHPVTHFWVIANTHFIGNWLYCIAIEYQLNTEDMQIQKHFSTNCSKPPETRICTTFQSGPQTALQTIIQLQAENLIMRDAEEEKKKRDALQCFTTIKTAAWNETNLSLSLSVSSTTQNRKQWKGESCFKGLNFLVWPPSDRRVSQTHTHTHTHRKGCRCRSDRGDRRGGRDW